MSLDLRKYPGVRLLALTIVGAICYDLLELAYFLILIVVLSIAIYLVQRQVKVLLYYPFGLVIGAMMIFIINENIIDFPNKIINNTPVLIEGKVEKILKSNDKQYKLIVHGSIDTKRLSAFEKQSVYLTIYQGRKEIDIKQGYDIFVNAQIRTPNDKQIYTDFNEKEYLQSHKATWIATARAVDVAILETTRSGFVSLLNNIKQSVKTKIETVFKDKNSDIIQAFLLGDKSEISWEKKQTFSLSGTAHVLAVSGLHVGLIAAMIYFLLGFMYNPWLKLFFFSSSILLFVLMVGLSPSALRAGIMAILVVFAKSTQRHINMLNIISLVVIAVLISSPELFFSIGFRMSVFAILGIVILYKPFVNISSKIATKSTVVRYLLNSIVVSISASLLVSPLVGYYFNVYSIISPIANLFVIPLMSLSMCFSVLAVLLSYIWIPLAEVYASASSLIIDFSFVINKFVIEFPFAFIKGSSAFMVAVLTSISIVYLLFSKNLKAIAFRTATVSLLVVILLIVSFERNNEVIPRQQYVAVNLPKQKRIILFDRKPSQKPIRDYAMEQYILENVFSELYYSGNAGLNIVDKIKNEINIKSISMDLKFQKDLESKLNLKYIPQMIEY